MYTPAHFREDRLPVLHAFMAEHPFATLITHGDSGISATHLPLALDTTAEPGVLRGHVARANPHWKTIGDGADALVIFQGPQAYVSPQWYPSKKDGGRTVPTWNYISVHARGRVRTVQDAEWLLRNVSDLSDRAESKFAEPWAVSDAPADYVEKMLRAIVGVEITITALEGTWKLSQNKTETDKTGVMDGLTARDDASRVVAEAMRKVSED